MRYQSLLTASLLAVLLATSPTASLAQVALPTALAKVYEENPTLLAARARLRSVDEGLPIARATRRPRASIASSVDFGRTETDRGAQNRRTLRNAVGIEQPLYTGC